MPLIEGLEEKIAILNQVYQKQLTAKLEPIRHLIPFRLLQELADEQNLSLYGHSALVRPELHNPKLIVPRMMIGLPLTFELGIRFNEGGYFGYLDYPEVDPITPFMKKVGITELGYWKDYRPSWEEYLGMSEESKQLATLRKLSQYNLTNARLVGGDNCAALYWQDSPGSSPNQIHSSWLGIKPRKEQSLYELVFHQEKLKTEEQWRQSIRKKFQGEDI